MLKLKELTKTFGGLRAVDRLTLDVREGSITALIGPNGSGKSTVFNMISGILLPSSGSIYWEDRAIDGLKPHKISYLGISRTFQELRIFNNLTVIENVMVGLRSLTKSGMFSSMLRLPKERRERKLLREKAEYLLELLGIIDRSDIMPNDLPYAVQRMVDIGRALANQAKVILLDEPAAGMNPKEAEDLSGALKRIRREVCPTIFLIEHNMKFVMNLSDYVGVLNYGRLLAEGAPEKIMNSEDVIRAYLGDAG
jgi:branched-chain amino acid transport system ATP-binding protein